MTKEKTAWLGELEDEEEAQLIDELILLDLKLSRIDKVRKATVEILNEPDLIFEDSEWLDNLHEDLAGEVDVAFLARRQELFSLQEDTIRKLATICAQETMDWPQ